MFFTSEQKPRFANCPQCGLTDTFLSTYNNARYCVRCHQLYDRTDEVRLRKQKTDAACGLFNTSSQDVAYEQLIDLT